MTTMQKNDGQTKKKEVGGVEPPDACYFRDSPIIRAIDLLYGESLRIKLPDEGAPETEVVSYSELVSKLIIVQRDARTPTLPPVP
jgi:hypothetical protein